DRDVLPVGSAGLAGALAKRLSAGRRSLPRYRAARPLFVCGSQHPTTLAQVGELRRQSRVEAVTGPRAAPDDVAAALRRLAERAEQQIAATEPDALVLTGGDTARAVLTRIGVDVIELLDEVLP